MQEAESAPGLVELGGGDAEVHQYPIHAAGETGGIHDAADFAEARMVRRHPRVGTGELARGRHRLRITVDRQHPARRPDSIEQRPGMSATPERAIDVAAAGARRNRLDDLGEHDGNVFGCMVEDVARRRSGAFSEVR